MVLFHWVCGFLAARSRCPNQCLLQSLSLCLSPSLSLCLSLYLIPPLTTCCSAPPPAAPSADTASGDGQSAACNPEQRIPGGGCCGPGAFFDSEGGGCKTVGPAVCAAVLPHDPRACIPRWCATWRDNAGAACEPAADGCLPEGRACTAAENEKGLGCLAGQWPQPDGSCAAAGPAAAMATLGKLEPVFAGTDPPAALPLPAETSFCPDGGGGLTLCAPGTAAPGCKVGEMPDPAKAGACLTVGVAWQCPPGFVSKSGACAPDPADCGAGPFGAIEPAPGVVFVDPSASPGGDGSLDKPVQSLQQAAPLTPAGGTVALAKGNYAGPLSFSVPLSVRGRCAALVTIATPAGPPAVRVKGGKADGEVLIEGATLTGASLGLAVDGALAARGRRLFIHKTFAAGVLVTGADARLTLEQSVIAGTKPDGFKQGFGAVAKNGAHLSLVTVRLSGNRNHGIEAEGATTRLALEQVWVDGTTPGGDNDWADGIGIYLEKVAEVSGRAVRVSDSTGAGIRLSNGTGKASFAGLLVEATKPDSLGEHGSAVRVLDGPSLVLSGARLSASHHAGALVVGAVELIANGLVIDDTKATTKTGLGVAGLTVGWGAKAGLRGVRISGNRDTGVLWSKNATGHIDRLVVDDTRPWTAGGAFGYGVSVQGGASLALRDARISGAKGFGIRVGDPGSRLQASNLAIDGVAAREKDGHLGYGFAVLSGAHAHVRGLRIDDCVENAVLVFGKAVRARLAGVALSAIKPNPKAKDPVVLAIAAMGGADLELAGASLTDQTGMGVYGSGPDGTLVRVAGLDYGGAAQMPGSFAVGVQADEGMAELRLVGSRIRGARSVAVAVAGPTADLRDMVLLDTVAGEHQPLDANGDPAGPKVTLSDGVVVRGTAAFALRDAVAFGQVRAGLFLDGAMTAQLANVLVGGGYFGEVFNGKPAVDRKAVLLLKNTQNQSNDAGLPVPKPPKLVPVGEL